MSDGLEYFSQDSRRVVKLPSDLTFAEISANDDRESHVRYHRYEMNIYFTFLMDESQRDTKVRKEMIYRHG